MLSTWIIFIDNDGEISSHRFLCKQQPDMFEDVIPLMENDGIALEEEDKHRLVSHGCANEVSVTWDGPLDPATTWFKQSDDLVRLWWRADSLEEVGQWTAQIIGLGGHIDKIVPKNNSDNTFAFIFTISRRIALTELNYGSRAELEEQNIAMKLSN